MPSYYCRILEDNMISEGKYSQEKLYGDGTSSKPRIDWEEEKAHEKNADKVEPIATHSPPTLTTKKWQ